MKYLITILLLAILLNSGQAVVNTTITAKEFLEELDDGGRSINKNHVIITGRLELPKDIQSISVTNSVVEGIFIMKKVTVRLDADFSGTQFKKDAIFEGTIFANKAGFYKVHFYEDVYFNSTYWKSGEFIKAVFESDAVFTDINKAVSADFTGSTFHGPVNFNSAIINDAVFKNAQFDKPAKFEGSTLNNAGISNFKNAQFSQLAKFEGATLNNADFENASFNQTADFKSAKGISNFKNAQFSQLAKFEGATLNNADFENASFNQTADFKSAKGLSNFKNAQFSQLAKFDGATLNNVDFENASFNQTAGFKSAKGISNFKNVQFSQLAKFEGATLNDANFENAKFGQQANFSNAKFSGSADFSDVDFSGNLSLRGCDFDKRADFDSFFHGFVDLTDSKKINADFQGASFSEKSKVILHNSSFGDSFNLNYDRINQPLPCDNENMLTDLLAIYGTHDEEIQIIIGKCGGKKNSFLEDIINGLTTYKTSIIPMVILIMILNIFVFPLIYYKERCLKKARSLSECLLFSISSIIYGRDSESEMPSTRCKWIQTIQVVLHYLLLGLIAILFAEIYIK